MADTLDIFTGILLTVIGLVLVYGSIIYRLIDLILILGVLITIFGLYKLLQSFVARLLNSRRGPRSRKKLNQKSDSTYSRVVDSAKEVESIINSKKEEKSKSKSKSKSLLGKGGAKESSSTLDEFLSQQSSKPKQKLDLPIDESKQVLRTKAEKEEKPKFKLPSIRKSNKPKKRSYGYLEENQEESSPDTVYFTPNYEKPMKVSRKPRRKSKETINLNNTPKRSEEISKALASVGDAETIYDNEVSDDSYSLIPKKMDEEIIMPIDEIDLSDSFDVEQIYTLSQSENTLYNNVIYDDGEDDGVITPIYADEVYKEEHGISDDDLEKEYSDLEISEGGLEITEDYDYIAPERKADVGRLPRPTSIASTNPISSKKENVSNLSRPHKKGDVIGAPKPKEREGEIPRPIPKIAASGLSAGTSRIGASSDGTITIDPNNPESIPIPKLLNSYVICDKGILTSQEAFEEVASHSKEEILLEAPTVKDMGDRFLSNLSNIKSRVIIEEFDLEDISYVLLLSSLLKKGVEIRTLPSVDSFNLIGDTSHALLISNSIDEDDFEYGAVYDDRESVENIKELFESSWDLASDLDISAIVENN